MTKDALRVTRRLSRQRGRNRAPRPKTFSSEEAANKWAKEQGFKNFKLENMKNETNSKKKFRVIVEV